jgi:DNA-binding NarL/FixJ family response regulator
MHRILVIEDEVDVKDSIIDVLKIQGFITQGASNGTSGLYLARTFYPELIICDIDMPDLTGYDILQEIQNNNDLNNIPFIFCTSLSGMKNLRKGMDLGADDYLIKPFQVDTLLKVVEVRLKKYVNHKLTISQFTSSSLQSQISEDYLLTSRQMDVLKLLVQGLKNKEIAENLTISIKTVEKHRKDIMERLKISSFVELVRYAIHIGLVN